ncbi:chitinase [Apiospora arundinis]
MLGLCLATENHNWDIVYEPSKTAWACCNDTAKPSGNCDVSLPGDPGLGEPFPAPAPSQLLTYYIVPTSTSYATVAASHNLSAGAAAGIGVGAALGTCLVGIGAGFLMLRRRRHRRQPTEGPLSQHDNKEPEQPQQQLRGAEGGYPGAPGAYDMGLQELEPRSRQLRELQGWLFMEWQCSDIVN